jgi:hypothetical protein
MMTWQQRRIAQLEDKAIKLMQLYERLDRKAAGKSGDARAEIHDRMVEVSLTISTTEATIGRLRNSTPI